MLPLAIQFPNISSELVAVDLFGMHLAIRWYALGYIVGILIGWWIIRRTLTMARLWAAEPPLSREQLEELVTWIVLGIILGGRLGFVLFYQPAYYLAYPGEIIRVWDGGMAFHGGFLGVVIATYLFCRKHKLVTPSVADLLAIAAPPGIGLVRVANFINAELWGRPTDLPWGVIFPGEAAQSCQNLATGFCARHPSQLYEAVLEGLILGILLLTLAWKTQALKKTPGLLAGIFFAGYGIARFIVEFFRLADRQYITPDNPFGHVFLGMTMGQLLSLPMVIVGIGTIFWARRRANRA